MEFARNKELYYLGSIPIDPEIVITSGNGAPLAGDNYGSDISAIFMDITKKIKEKINP